MDENWRIDSLKDIDKEMYEQTKQTGFMGFDYVTNQIYICIDIQKWYVIC